MKVYDEMANILPRVGISASLGRHSHPGGGVAPPFTLPPPPLFPGGMTGRGRGYCTTRRVLHFVRVLATSDCRFPVC